MGNCASRKSYMDHLAILRHKKEKLILRHKKEKFGEKSCSTFKVFKTLYKPYQHVIHV